MHLDKSGLRHVCFPRNLRTAFLERFKIAVLTIWSDQFWHAFTRHDAFVAVFTFHFCLGFHLSFHICVK